MLLISLYSIWSIRTTFNNFISYGKTRFPKEKKKEEEEENLNLRWCIQSKFCIQPIGSYT